MLFYFKKRLTRFGRDFSCFSSQNLSLASGNFPEITWWFNSDGGEGWGCCITHSVQVLLQYFELILLKNFGCKYMFCSKLMYSALKILKSYCWLSKSPPRWVWSLKGNKFVFAYLTSFVSFHRLTQASSENPSVILHGVCMWKEFSLWSFEFFVFYVE